MKKQISLLAMGLLPLSMALAQQADQKMLPTGSGGMNQSMGNLSSPNLFDGSTNVNIPIHTFGDFGVSLSYNTKGVPVEEISGPAGTHWVLNAGGSITRNVKDIPDEVNQTFNVPSAYNNTVEYSILGRAHAYNAGPPPNNRQYRDRENDEFIVSAGPMQFTFRLGKNGHVFTYPENRYKISPIIAPGMSPTGIHIYYKFEITDDQGTKYYFGTRASEANGSIAFGNMAPGTGGGGYVKDFIYTPKWFLDKVEFTNGQVIDYTYEYMDYPTDGSGTEGLSLYRPNTRTFKPTVIVEDPPTDPTWMADIQPSTYILTGIRYPDNTTVNFVFDQGAGYQPSCMKSIKQIEIAQGGNCIKYRLNKAYLKQSTANYLLAEEVPFDNGCNYNPEQGISLRMILKGIDILSCDESKVQPYYSFEYSHTAPPSRWGNNRDFFGYCNYIVDPNSNNNTNPNYLNNYLLQPTDTKSPFDNSNGPAANINRRVTDDVNIMAALCLTKVKNAYGGSVAFEYELHSGLVSVTDGLPGQPDPAGNLANHLFTGKNAADGLRLRRTITEDNYRPDSKLITNYTYSGGQFFLNGGYYAYPLVKSVNGSFTQYKGTPYWVSAHQLINGSNHGYSQVTAISSDNGGNMLSKTIYYFSNFKEGNTLNYNFPNASANQKHYYQVPYTDKQYIMDWKIGLPVKTETFDQNGNIASRTTNVYNTDIANDFVSAADWLDVNVHTMRVSLENPGSTVNIMDPAFELPTDSYVPFRGKALLLSTTTEKFTSNTNAVTDIAEYKYDSRYNLTEIKTRNSKNEYFLTRNIYNYNVNGSAVLSAMTAAGMEKVISTERWKKGSTSPAGDELYDAGITCYQYQNGLLLTQKVYTLQSLLPIPYNSYTNTGSAAYNRILAAYNNPGQTVTDFRPVSEVMQYDSRNNPVETRLGDQEDYQSMIWDEHYNKGATSNARLKDIGFTSFERNPAGNTGANTELSDGRFTYKFSGVQGIAGAVSGGRIYNLSPATYIKSPMLTAGQAYEMTLWTNGAAPQVSGAGVTLSFIPAYENSDWKCYKASFTPTANGILNFYSPASIRVDEVRLFPAGATMTNAVYAPLLGPTSATDATGRITYYEYDNLGRQHITRNQEGYILSKKEYHLEQ